MKKKILAILAFALVTSFSAYSQTLTLEIRGIEKVTGSLYIGFYSSAKTFTKEAVFGVCEKVTGKIMVIPVKGLAKGSYAISMFQDENANKKLDTGPMGIPVEKYGFSNDARGFAGPPSFKKCLFEFKGDKKLIIHLI